MYHVRRTIRELIRRAMLRSTPVSSSHPDALDCLIASNEFGAYCVPRSSLHRPAAQSILRGQSWEPETIAFMRANCGSGDIIHAGTYYGDFLPALATSLANGALVWAFEANAENFRCAGITVALNAIGEKVQLTHAALGAASGQVALAVSDSSGRALGGSSHVDPGGTQRVAVVALDAVIPAQRRIAILQLDVEGYEEQALRGAEALIKREKPVLILETVPVGAWFDGLLAECGYVPAGKFNENFAFWLGD